MLVYIRRKLFHCYLEKEPNYSLPLVPKHVLREVEDLKPSLEAVNICHHGGETTVVLEGRNLWFCYQTTVGEHHQLLPAQKATASSIQFNLPLKSVAKGEKVKVSLQSHFSKAVKYCLIPNIEVNLMYVCHCDLDKTTYYF